MERVEDTELDARPDTKKNSSGVAKKASSKDWSSSNDKKGTKHCTLHGKGYHSTSECRDLQAKNKRFKGDSSKGSYKKKPYENKSWSRTADDNKSRSKSELNALIKKAISKGVQKELNAIQVKRKSDDSSVDEDGELNMMYNMADFNYDDMENLTIEDTTEIEV